MTNPSITVSHLFGEITWLFTQSSIHRALPIFTLELIAMPPIVLEQMYLFRDGEKPVGVALWAYCNESAEKKLEKGLVGADDPFTFQDWKSGNNLWLVDLVAPFSTDKNDQRTMMMADLVSEPLRGKAFRYHKTEFESGDRTVIEVPADAGDRMSAALAGSNGSVA